VVRQDHDLKKLLLLVSSRRFDWKSGMTYTDLTAFPDQLQNHSGFEVNSTVQKISLIFWTVFLYPDFLILLVGI
jgi:hypothetical protein